MGIITEQPLISRLQRLDNMQLRQLEEMRGFKSKCNSRRSPTSSTASTPLAESGTGTCFTCSEGHANASSIDFSPTCLDNHCRPIDYVTVETQVKGTLIERLQQAEDRLLKLEEQVVAENSIGEKNTSHRKGIKQFVKQCVKGKHYSKLKS